MQLYAPVSTSTVLLTAEKTQVLEENLASLAETRGGVFRSKQHERHFGSDLTEPYEFRQFGYCSMRV